MIQSLARGRCVALALALGLFFQSGCGSRSKPLWSQGQAAGVLREALEAPLPDTRRRSIERVTTSRYADTDIALETMVVIVEADESPIVRRAAVRCLTAGGRAEAYPSLRGVLVRASEASVRKPVDGGLVAAALDGVERLAVEPEIQDRAEADGLPDAVTMLLRSHPDREVRLRAARLLGRFPKRSVVEGLIEALQQEDFAVHYEAAGALNRLTGQKHGYSYARWNAWFETTDDPLAVSGQ